MTVPRERPDRAARAAVRSSASTGLSWSPARDPGGNRVTPRQMWGRASCHRASDARTAVAARHADDKSLVGYEVVGALVPGWWSGAAAQHAIQARRSGPCPHPQCANGRSSPRCPTSPQAPLTANSTSMLRSCPWNSPHSPAALEVHRRVAPRIECPCSRYRARRGAAPCRSTSRRARAQDGGRQMQ